MEGNVKFLWSTLLGIQHSILLERIVVDFILTSLFTYVHRTDLTCAFSRSGLCK